MVGDAIGVLDIGPSKAKGRTLDFILGKIGSSWRVLSRV